MELSPAGFSRQSTGTLASHSVLRTAISASHRTGRSPAGRLMSRRPGQSSVFRGPAASNGFFLNAWLQLPILARRQGRHRRPWGLLGSAAPLGEKSAFTFSFGRFDSN